MPPEGVPCSSSLGVLAVSPLHGIACPGTQLPHAFCTGQQCRPAFPGPCLASSSPLLTAWHSPSSPFQSCSRGTAAQVSACAAMTAPLLSPGVLRRLVPPAPGPSCSLPPSLSLTLAGPPGGCQRRSQLCITIFRQPADTALLQHSAM